MIRVKPMIICFFFFFQTSPNYINSVTWAGSTVMDIVTFNLFCNFCHLDWLWKSLVQIHIIHWFFEVWRIFFFQMKSWILHLAKSQFLCTICPPFIFMYYIFFSCINICLCCFVFRTLHKVFCFMCVYLLLLLLFLNDE